MIYVNDIEFVSSELFTFLFADDFNSFGTGKNAQAVIDIVNKEIKSMVQWLKVNKMSLNLDKTRDKTHFMVLATHNKIINLNEGIVISQVRHTKFPRIITDCTLNWKEHVSYMCNKIAKILEFW